MVEANQHGVFTGTLFAGPTAEEDDAYSGDNLERLRRGVVFETEGFEILFRSGIGGYLPLEDDHFTEENGELFYYPYFNETVAEVNNPSVDTSEMEVVRDSVSVHYKVVDGDVYLFSQCEVTAYSPIHAVVDGEVYSLETPFMTGDGMDFESDPFLGLEQTERAVLAENVETGVKMPVSQDTVNRIVKGEFNGALKLRDPDSLSQVRELLESLQ